MAREPCKYWRGGFCFRGANCWYAHEERGRRPTASSTGASLPSSASFRSPSSRSPDARSRSGSGSSSTRRRFASSSSSAHSSNSYSSSSSSKVSPSHRSSSDRPPPLYPAPYHTNSRDRASAHRSSSSRAPVMPPMPSAPKPPSSNSSNVNNSSRMQSAVVDALSPGTDGEDAAAGSAQGDEHAWGESFLDAVAKCDGASGKKLYLYGISSTRCPSCRHRVKIESDVCANCEFKHQRARSCKMCTVTASAMWCFECDAYFCEKCHQKPHVLELRGDAPARHKCFAIEGASGRMLKKSAWAQDFAVMAKRAYRLRVAEKESEKNTAPVAGGTESVAAAAAQAPVSARDATEQFRVLPSVSGTASPPHGSTSEVIQQQQQQQQQRPDSQTGTSIEAGVRAGAIQVESAPSNVTPATSAPAAEQPRSQEPPRSDASRFRADATSSASGSSTHTGPRVVPGADRTRSAGSTEQPGSPSRKRKLSDVEIAQRSIPVRTTELSLVERVRLMHEQKMRQTQQTHQEMLARREAFRVAEQRQQAMNQQHQQRLRDIEAFRERHQARHEQVRIDEEKRKHAQEMLQQSLRNTSSSPAAAQHQEVSGPASVVPSASAGGSASSHVHPVATPEPDVVQQIDTDTMRQHAAASQASLVPAAETGTGISLMMASANPIQSLQMQRLQVQLQRQQQLQQLQLRLHQQHHYQQQQHHPQQNLVHQPSPSVQHAQASPGGNESGQTYTNPPTPSSSTSTTSGGDTSSALPAISRDINTSNTPHNSAVVPANTDSSNPSTSVRSASNYSGASSSVIGDDPLTIAVVNEYDEINNHVLYLETSNAKLNEKVRQISMQDVTTAAKLNDQIKVYRTKLELAYERRFEALAKVIMFSPDVRSRVKKIDQNTLGDIPHVLTACNLKCAQLAANIKKSETHVQDLRSAIDVAISSGDPEKLGQLHLLGKQISNHEQQIQTQRAERDDQFVLMIQYSRKLREVVRSHVVQSANAKAKASGTATAAATAPTRQ